MIVKIASLWELGWNTPILEIDLWHFLLRDFGINQCYMVPISGIKHKGVQERATIKDVIDENPSLQVIFCDERGEQNLKDFIHPENALYIFGKTNFSPFLLEKRKQDISLYFETAMNIGTVWSHQAAGIILYDRLRKL